MTQKHLVCIDFSDASNNALREAAALKASNPTAQITLLYVHQITQVSIMDFSYVTSPDVVAQACTNAEAALSAACGEHHLDADSVTKIVATGDPADEICRHADGMDLVIIGTHGREGLAHLMLGSVAEKVVRSAPCSVLVAKN